MRRRDQEDGRTGGCSFLKRIKDGFGMLHLNRENVEHRIVIYHHGHSCYGEKGLNDMEALIQRHLYVGLTFIQDTSSKKFDSIS